MNKTFVLKKSRIYFLDNIRTLMVILVVIFHCGSAYSSAVKFWPFHEKTFSRLIDFYMLLGDVFMMSTLFFIAGFFAIPSYKKRGGKSFLINKFKVLGIPWFIITILILPIIDYINYFFNSSIQLIKINFSTYWLLSIKKILQFNFGFLDMSKYIIMPDQYYQRYMWFLSLLLFFFFIFAFYMWIKNHLIKKNHVRKNKSNSKTIPFIVIGVLTIVLFGTVKLLFYDEILGSGWFSFGHLLEFQLGKFMIYGVYFAFGVYAYNKEWFISSHGPKRTWIWGLSCFILFGINMMVFKIITSTSSPLLIYKLLHVVFYPLWVLSFLGVFLSLGFKYWNKSTPFNKSMASNSYNIYLVHYFFAMTIPLLLSNWVSIPVILKFIMVSVSTLILSYTISRFVIKKHPKIFIFSLTGLAFLLSIISS